MTSSYSDTPPRHIHASVVASWESFEYIEIATGDFGHGAVLSIPSLSESSLTPKDGEQRLDRVPAWRSDCAKYELLQVDAEEGRLAADSHAGPGGSVDGQTSLPESTSPPSPQGRAGPSEKESDSSPENSESTADLVHPFRHDCTEHAMEAGLHPVCMVELPCEAGTRGSVIQERYIIRWRRPSANSERSAGTEEPDQPPNEPFLQMNLITPSDQQVLFDGSIWAHNFEPGGLWPLSIAGEGEPADVTSTTACDPTRRPSDGATTTDSYDTSFEPFENYYIRVVFKSLLNIPACLLITASLVCWYGYTSIRTALGALRGGCIHHIYNPLLKLCAYLSYIAHSIWSGGVSYTGHGLRFLQCQVAVLVFHPLISACAYIINSAGIMWARTCSYVRHCARWVKGKSTAQTFTLLNILVALINITLLFWSLRRASYEPLVHSSPLIQCHE